MKRRILSLILVFILVFSLTAFADDTNVTTDAAKSITIIHTNDIHARAVEDNSGIGYAKLAALAADALSKTGVDPILADAGDALHGQTIATVERGESIVNIMNKVGYDVMAPGNHDFNYGSGRLLELAGKAAFKIISANVTNTDGTAFLDEYTIIERSGVKIAFFGLSTPETAYKTNPKNIEGLSFTDPVKAAQTMSAELQDKADVIVCISHLGLDPASEITSKIVAEKVQGIDVIIDGHSHTALAEPLKVNNTIIVQTGEYFKNIGMVQIDLDSANKVTGIKASLYTKEQSAEIAPREDVVKAINDYTEAQKSILSEVVLKSEINFDGERADVRTGPTNLSCLITTAMVNITGADIAITNGGGIRASIEAGDVTRGEIISVLPFGNYIVTKKMKGSDIKAALEHGLSKYPETNGAFPQVANVEYLFDETKPAGERVTHIWIKGVKLDLNKEYIVATNDFMAVGGDGYPFKDLPLINEYQALDEALIAYVSENPDMIKYEKYTIVSGDALWKIARKTGHYWLEIAKINKLENPDLIYAGDTLLIPAW
jgi:5'-nucleotidase